MCGHSHRKITENRFRAAFTWHTRNCLCALRAGRIGRSEYEFTRYDRLTTCRRRENTNNYKYFIRLHGTSLYFHLYDETETACIYIQYVIDSNAFFKFLISFVILSHTTQNGRFGLFGSKLRYWNSNNFSCYFLQRKKEEKKLLSLRWSGETIKTCPPFTEFSALVHAACMVCRYNEFRFRFAHTAFISY